MIARKKLLSFEEVDRMLSYGPVSGLLTWKVERYRKHPGDIAGCCFTRKSNGYTCVTVSINYKRYPVHCVAWLLMTGDWPKHEIDHKDSNGANNKWSNLREATRLQNAQHVRMKKTNTLGVKGVCLAKKKGLYRARITVKRREIFLGYFENLNDAGAAYRAAALKYFGEFAEVQNEKV